MLLDDAEFELLEHIEKHHTVPKNQRSLAHRLASLGILHLGYDDQHANGLQETGHPSYLGEQLLDLERIQRNPIRRVMHSILMPFI